MEGGREGPGAGREEGGQSSCERRRGRTGRGDVTHPPAAKHCNDFFIAWDPFISLLLLQPFFSPSRTRWAVVPPEAGRLLGRGGVTTSGGPARSQPKRGNRWLLDRADGHGDFNSHYNAFYTAPPRLDNKSLKYAEQSLRCLFSAVKNELFRALGINWRINCWLNDI